MARLICFLVAGIFSFTPTHVFGITVRVDGSIAGNPPTITHNPSSSTPLSVSVQIENGSSVSELISLWQLSLEVVGTSQSTGELLISGFNDPISPFFDSPLSGISPPALASPSLQATFQDADVPLDPNVLPGRSLMPGEIQDLLTLNLVSSGDVQGNFQLVLNAFEPPQGGSFWLGDFLSVPQAFGNTPSPAAGNQIVLAEFIVVPEPSTIMIACGGLFYLALRASRR